MGNACPATRGPFRHPPSAIRLAAGRLALLWLLASSGTSALAAEAPPAASDAALEKRVTDVASELRCLVCQNQTLADSNAPLAVDLRNQIREQMEKGASERAVVDYMVTRYGDFVLYRPPLKATTILLWAGPALLAIAGLLVLYLNLARRRRAGQAGLSDEERARAQRLLAGDGGPHPESRPPGGANPR
jgi:cytochrome c-type biogenesis protein CcmH